MGLEEVEVSVWEDFTAPLAVYCIQNETRVRVVLLLVMPRQWV